MPVPRTILWLASCRAFLFLAGAALATRSAPAAQPVSPGVSEFLRANCLDCHQGDSPEGGLDLSAFAFDPATPENFARWVLIHDRVKSGEMPPADAGPPAAEDKNRFVQDLSAQLIDAERARMAGEGRATRRRMNRHEYENTLRDLLAVPCLEVRDFLPEDSVAHGFNKVGDALDTSQVQLARYLAAAEYALRRAMAPQATRPESTLTRYYAWDMPGFRKNAGPEIRKTFRLLDNTLQAGGFFRRRRGEPAEPQPPPPPVTHDRERESVAIVISTYEPTEIQFNRFRAPVTARYRLRFSAYSIWMSLDFRKGSKGHRPEPVTIYSDRTPSIYRKLGSFDVGPEPTVRELDVGLIAGETIRPDASRLVRCRPPDFKNPFAEADGMPGVAFQWMEVEGPLYDDWPPTGHKLLFGELPLVDAAPPAGPPSYPPPRRFFREPAGVKVVSGNPEMDAERLLRRFLGELRRGASRDVDVERFTGIVRGALSKGYDFTDAMIAAYTGILSSPSFIFFDEKPGRLEDRAVAERLSYFLWNTRPDAELVRLAQSGELGRPAVLQEQTERMLNDPRSVGFVNAFLDYWLDLRKIEATSPDVALYPDYDLDDLLMESALDETRLFFAELLRHNGSAANLIDSDFAILNERLAVHYGLDGVEGVAMRRVPLPAGSIRGGLLTQAAVLKVTANGTTTSPVTRGAWVMTRLLGKPPPPPPAAVPAVEPDTRGATTIREQLAKHRSIDACNVCHRQIDPVGFALESFDVFGGYRDRYRSLGEGERVKGIGHNGQRFQFVLGPAVDPRGELPDGQTFGDVQELKRCLLRDPAAVARNLIQQLTVYATGAPVRFTDRQPIEAILEKCRVDNYGLRTMVHEIVQSDLFLHK